MATIPVKRRPIKQQSSEKEYDTETPPSPTATSDMLKNKTRHHHSSRISNPLNVYKADQDRIGASFKTILFLAATTLYTAFLYSGAGRK